MPKNLSARIAERASLKKPSRSAQNRAAFLALRADVKQAMDDGWSVKTIWETLHEEGKIGFSYQAFRGYVNRLIPSNSDTVQAVSPAGEKHKKPHHPVEPRSHQPELSGFQFNASPKKEDLL